MGKTKENKRKQFSCFPKESRTKEKLQPNQENMRMFFLVFVLFL